MGKRKFAEIMHYNRDETSFIARIFENSLFPRWFREPESFKSFLDLLKRSSEANLEKVVTRFPRTNIKSWDFDEELKFVDGMICLDNVDIFGYYMHHHRQYEDIIITEVDKTEFDAVIVAEDSRGREHVIVFNVSCYSEIEYGEIMRQNFWLEKFRKGGLYHSFHHFALAGYDCLDGLRCRFSSKRYKNCTNGIYLITFEDLKPEFPENRFKDIDFFLHNTVKHTGVYKVPRKLLKREE